MALRAAPLNDMVAALELMSAHAPALAQLLRRVVTCARSDAEALQAVCAVGACAAACAPPQRTTLCGKTVRCAGFPPCVRWTCCLST